MRQGKWKYVTAKHNVPNYAQDTQRKEVEELYDLDADVGEKQNLADQYPDKVAELRTLLQEIRNRE